MANFAAVVKQLQQERTRAAEELERLDQAISMLVNLGGNTTGRGRPRGRLRLSLAAGRKIAAAQRARWARVKSGRGSASAKSARKSLSAAGRRSIAAAARVRWAKWRKKHGKKPA